MSHSINGVDDDDLRCLIMWPEGTVGYRREFEALKYLNMLCKIFGYGRLPQLTEGIEQLWRDPDKKAAFEEQRRRHLEFVAECRKSYEPHEDPAADKPCKEDDL